MEVSARGRLIYIEPNNLSNFNGIKLNGNSQDNIVWNPEDLNYSVDLQVVVPDRTQCGGDIANDGLTFTLSNINKNGMLSFFEGTTVNGKKMLTDNYTDASFAELKDSSKQNKECLGIKSINVDFSSYFYPQVTIEFTDVRAFSLMGPSETSSSTESFFKSVFHYPYPKFLLTIKGYYGTKVTFKLAVNEFKSRLNQQTGNFDVTITFIGYMFGVYTDIPTNFILIAPYICGETEGSTNAYWNQGKESGRFVYNDNTPMLTMVEFCDKYVRLAETLSTQNNLLDENKALKDFNTANRKAEDAGKLIDLFNTFIDTANMGDTAQCKKIENKNLYLFYGNGKKVELNKNLVYQKLRDALTDFNKAYGTDFQNINGTTTVQTIVDVVTTPLVVNGEINPQVKSLEMYKKMVNEKLEDGETKKILDIFSANKSEFEKKNWYLFDSNHFLLFFKNIKNEAESKVTEATPEAESESLNITVKEIGFTPNLENIFRMVFAHLDCFMNSMYDVIKKVKESKRSPDDMKMTTDDTDLPSMYDFVPPFPLITERKDDKRIAIFPGEKEQYANMEEVVFVDEIVKATLAYRKLFNAIEDYLKKSQQSEETNGDFVQNFFPIMLSDVFYNGTNPYKYLNDNTDLGEILYMHLLRYRAARMTGGARSTKDIDATYADLEARNFYMVKSSCTDEFLQELKRIGNSPYEDFLNKVNEYLNNHKNQTIDTVNISGDKILTKVDDKYALSFNNVITPKATQIVKQRYPVNPEAKNLESGFGIKDSSWKTVLESYSNMTKINEKFPESKRIEEDKLKYVTHYVKLDASGFYGINKEKGESYKYGRLYKKPSGNDNFDDTTSISSDDYVNDYVEVCKSNPESMSFPFIEYGTVNMDAKRAHNLFVNDTQGGGGVIYKKSNGQPRTWEERALMFLACLPFSTTALEMARCAVVGIRPTISLKIKGNNSTTTEDSVDVVNEGYITQVQCIPRHILLYIGGLLYKSKNPGVIDGLTIKNEKKGSSVSIRTRYGKFVLGHNLEDMEEGQASRGVKECDEMDEEKKQFIIDYFTSWANNDFKTMFEYLENGNGKYELKKVANDYNAFVLKNDPAENYLKQFYISFAYVYTNTAIGEYREKQKTNEISISDGLGCAQFCDALAKLYEDATDTEVKNREVTDADISKETKLSIYLTLKKMYDKWLCGVNGDRFKLGTYTDDKTEQRERFTGNGGSETASSEFTNFLFMDSYMNDIGTRFMVNPKVFYSMIKKHSDSDENTSIFQFLSDLSLENKLRLLSLPVYNNFYDAETLQRIFSPNPSYAIGNTASSKMGETYVVMYQHEASSMLEESNAEGILYGSNGFDIADSLGNPNAVSMDDVNRLFGATTEDNLNINVPAFGVTFGRQSQSMFKDIKVNMDGPRVTDFSIANTFELGKLGANGFAREPYSVGQDMFAIYSNRSYNCEVEMMGCANIFPFMYFQLNNVPMFKGAYIITDVKHSIAPGDMKTKFTGVRVSKNQIPFNTDIFNIRSFLAMIDGYVKNGGRYDKPSLTVSSGVAMGGDGSGIDFSGGVVNTSMPTTLKGGVADEYHLILQRYRRLSDGCVIGVIYEAGSKKVICHTLEHERQIKRCSAQVGAGIHTVVPGGQGWCTNSSAHHRGASAYTASLSAGKKVNYGSIKNGKPAGKAGTLTFGPRASTPMTMLGCKPGGGCLFHMGPNTNQAVAKPWTEGCVLIGDTCNDQGIRDDFSAAEYGPEKIFTSTNRHVVAYRNFYNVACSQLNGGKCVYIEMIDAYKTNANTVTISGGGKTTTGTLKLPSGWVELKDGESGIYVNSRYATDYNFVGKVCDGYRNANRCVMRSEVKEKLIKVQKYLDKNYKGLHLYIFDAGRPAKCITGSFLRFKSEHGMKGSKANALIANKSKHNQGFAVDLTIKNMGYTKNDYNQGLWEGKGTMGTLFDGFMHKTPNGGITKYERGKGCHWEVDRTAYNSNNKYHTFLRSVMHKNGFSGYSAEWWHFNAQDASSSNNIDFIV